MFTRKKTMATVTTTKTKSASKSGNSVKDKITSEKKRQTSKESGLSDDAAMADDQAGHRSTVNIGEVYFIAVICDIELGMVDPVNDFKRTEVVTLFFL